MNVTITLGGLLIGLAILVRQFLPWIWKALPGLKAKRGGKPGGEPHPDASGKLDAHEHIPFGIGTLVGMLAIASTGGLLGKSAGWIVQGSNKIGDTALHQGTASASTSVTRHASTQLADTGSMVALLLVVGVAVLWKVIDKARRRQMFSGVWCGSTLGLSAGAAGLLGSVIIPTANNIGGFLAGKM